VANHKIVAREPEFQFEGDEPMYRQVAHDLRRRIVKGDFAIGASVGDINALAKYYGCSFGTVSRAEHLLVDEGLLSEIRAGVPTRVIAKPAARATGEAVGKLRKLRRELDDIISGLEGLRA
jgi:DNA-binding GntR family transcriptional regulator